ncbi:MAG: hypothetical protein ACYDDA_01555 [Acidiferrobacteraceae bacterium]
MPVETHNKVTLAIEQLDTAISLFLEGKSDVATLTLAGAAEVILGMAVKINGIENSLQELYRFYDDPGLMWLNPKKTWSKFTTQGKNKVQNAVKHLSSADDLIFDADVKEEALWMLVRAIGNHQRLGFGSTELMNKFEEWFYANVVGI